MSPRRLPAAHPAVENIDIARMFQDVADLLDIQGENVFRIRAYRNAARMIETLGTPVASRGWCETRQIANTRPLDEFLRLLRRA